MIVLIFRPTQKILQIGQTNRNFGNRHCSIQQSCGDGFRSWEDFCVQESLKPYKPNRIVNVFTFRRRHSTQEAWSIHRFGKITIDLKHFESIKQMQFTPFNNQLVILYVNIHNENNIWFQYQTDGENSDPEIWRLPITLPELAIWMHSSPSTGKVYLLYRYPHRIEEYGFSDGLHIRSISLGHLEAVVWCSRFQILSRGRSNAYRDWITKEGCHRADRRFRWTKFVREKISEKTRMVAGLRCRQTQ